MEKGMDIDIVSLRKGADDFRYLLGRNYPRQRSLELVGNRYGLNKDGRELLHRSVFSSQEATRRREKLLRLDDTAGASLAVDGHNVLITIEAALLQKPVVLADDGVIRDILGISSGYRMTDVTLRTVDLIMEILRDSKPRNVVFLFDSPISKSGRLASYVADCLGATGLVGEARAVKVPERILIGYRGVVATSDSAIIDRVEKVVDLAGYVIRNRIPAPWLITL